jgi:hypothetical protein
MSTAEQHLDKAKEHLAYSDDHVRQAAQEIAAAKAADSKLSNRQIALRVGRSHTWVNLLVKWYGDGNPGSTPPFWKPTAAVVAAPADTVAGSAEDELSSDEWYTRRKYIEAVRKVLGGIDLDPASCDAAQDVVNAKQYFTKEDDGLKQEWRGRVWMNPPYSRGLINLFTDKLLKEYASGNVTAAIMLVSGRTSNCSWFKPLYDFPMVVAFERVYRRPGRPLTEQPNAVPYFVFLGHGWEAINKFVGVFEPFGQVIKDPSDRNWEKRYSAPISSLRPS